ncbi:glucosamine inositolphosphorylceramide transferase family protein [Leclercia adecarboxylata]|uniref:glucosamine inositolphosphorylceramide transferase family protein n=1 Tax=Leclercia adecarboxylata TaxID=83655 RepID=UPI003C7D34F2
MFNKNNRIIKKLFFHESWDIMIINSNGQHVFPDNTLDILKNSKAQQLHKKYIFQADPFIIDKDDRLYVFYEAFSFLNSKGVLRCRILNKALEEIEDLKLEGFDDLKCHLSFPFLFQLDGKLFMIPESSERKEVILFQSVDFPARWEKVKVLVSDMAVTDNVVFELDGVSYLVSTTMDNELVIHTSEGLLGDWKLISPNLDVCNVHFRGAGKPYSINNKTYIFTQECNPDVYGKSIFIKELTSLTPHNYEEKLVGKISASINNSDGIHTLNFTDNYIVYDTKHLTFSLLSTLKKLAYKIMVSHRKRLFNKVTIQESRTTLTRATK